MRSPIHAVLWENWRVTRLEATWRLALGLVGAWTVLTVLAAVAPRQSVKDFSAAIALILLVVPHFVGWLSLGKLNGGRPGFPFCLLFTRPLRTAVLVAIPMAYLTAAPVAIYVVSALILRLTSGYPFPLLSVAAWIAALNLTYLVVNWSTRSRVAQMLGMVVANGYWFSFASNRLTATEIPGFDWPPNLWPSIFNIPLTDYALIVSIGLASFGVAVAVVARQRHGDARSAMPWTEFPGRLVNLFRFTCPTSSARWAQVWFELKSNGLPVMAIGLVIGSVHPLLFAVSVPFAWIRPIVIMLAMFSVGTVLILGSNAFGIRYRQGRLYGSAFEATQAAGSAQLAGIKVLVRSVCVQAALIMVGASIWASLAFIAVGKGYEPLRSWQRALESVGALTGYQQVALAVVASVGGAVMVASLAALGALWTRYSRRLNIAGSLLLLYGLALALLKPAEELGIGSEFLRDALFGATRWIAAAAMALTTVYLFWSGLAERWLTLRYVCGALLVSAAFGAAWLTMLRAAGAQLAGMPTMDAAWMLSPALLLMMASVLAPWSLNRIRHL
ncbi:MAG TPA: hypothetical protein VJ302_17040 [Blastocatellia bacterium]|nr:hypothetical protein [Blastocatellia bacterium]